ncbi:MAG: Crp/Fnr family transcriptional regulator [Terriglobia bacterium]
MPDHIDKSTRAASLKKVPFFSELQPNALQAMAESAVTLHFHKGELIFLEGGPCPGLFVVHSGAIKIFKTSPAGREQTLAIESPGRPIAELAVLDEGPYPASAMAIEDSVLFMIPKAEFHRLCHQHPDIAFRIIRSLAGRFRKLVGLVEILAFLEVGQRLARFLIEKANQDGKATSHGVEVQLEMSHQDIASRIGTVRELVSRSFSRFQEQGMLVTKNRAVTIVDMERLKSEAELG